jgi:hypothetical protein
MTRKTEKLSAAGAGRAFFSKFHELCAEVDKASTSTQVIQQFSFWWTGVRPKGHTGLEKDLAAILGRLGLIQGRDGGARQPAERRAALL